MMIKRFLALMIAGTMALSAAGCNKADNKAKDSTAESTPKTSGLPASYASDKRIKVSYLIQEHASTPFKKDWAVWKNITEATNIEFDFMPAAGEAFNQKIRMLFSTNDLPDLINFNLATANEFGVAGQLEKVNNHIDKMPNFKAVLDAEGDARDTLTAGDGNMYFLPVVGLPKYTKVWMYRSDIFKKHNLKAPTNAAELYDSLKQLKQLYPASTPLINRNSMSSIIGNLFVDMAYQWGTGMMVYFNDKTNKWQFGPTEDNFKEMLKYLNKLAAENLLDPEWPTLATKQWEDKMYADDKAFVTFDYIYRIETMLPTATQKNPDWKLEALEPINQGGIGEKKYSIRSQIVTSDGMMVSSKSKYKDELFKLVDYLYSKEGALLANFGKEGETAVKSADGTYNWSSNIKTPLNPGGKDEYNTTFGFMTLGSYLQASPDTNQILYLSNKDVKSAFDLFDKNGYAAPLQPILRFTDAERKQVAELETSIRDYALAETVKFVQNGNFDKWNDYVAKIKALKVDQLLEIYNTMQARQK